MNGLDWLVVGIYCAGMLTVGIYFTRQASRSPEDFFIGGRRMPWWLIGLSDVASYGAASAPWIMLFYLGGFGEFWLVGWVTWCIWMPLVAVIWAKMWRRLGVVTTAEFIERRYSGRAASIVSAHVRLVRLCGLGVAAAGQRGGLVHAVNFPHPRLEPRQGAARFRERHYRLYAALGLLRGGVDGADPVLPHHDRCVCFHVHGHRRRRGAGADVRPRGSRARQRAS